MVVMTGLLAGFGRADEGPLRFRIFSIQDNGPVSIGGEASRMLVPVGWEAQSRILWGPPYAALVGGNVRVHNPRGAEVLEMFPLVGFTWQQGGIYGFPPGKIYLGREVQPVIVEPEVFIRQRFLPRYRPGRAVRFVSSTPQPEVAQSLAAAMGGGMVKAGKVRLEYEEQGRVIHEDVHCALTYSQSPYVAGSFLWQPVQLFSFKAEKGKLDQVANVMHAMVSSVTLDLAWFNRYQQVVQQWEQIQFQAIQHAGAISRIISQTSEEISPIRRQAYATQQATNDRVFRGYSKYVRGIETYSNPFDSRSVQLPSGYRDAWVSAQGEYTLSNDAGYNPNEGSTQTWRRMETIR
jgi:hypothetical protein